MQQPESVGQPQGSGLRCESGTASIEIRKLYGGEEIPPGSKAVEDRVLARYVPPGTRHEPHGVPPIGIIGLPAGWVMEELFDGVEELRVLPFRYPLYSRAYALHCGDRLCAVLRNVQPFDLSLGNQVVVQYNESFDWTAVFGTLVKVGTTEFRLRSPDSDETEIDHEKIHFVGKVMCWWDEAARSDVEGACG
ncbi:MAG: hypothetical protein H7Z14_06635 [Anaerolineae bacterium]|nr:hypothetical protein [Phycisphaerae bacterium]